MKPSWAARGCSSLTNAVSQAATPVTHHPGQREIQNASTLYFPPPGEGLFVPKTRDKLVTDHFNSNQLVKQKKVEKTH